MDIKEALLQSVIKQEELEAEYNAKCERLGVGADFRVMEKELWERYPNQMELIYGILRQGEEEICSLGALVSCLIPTLPESLVQYVKTALRAKLLSVIDLVETKSGTINARTSTESEGRSGGSLG